MIYDRLTNGNYRQKMEPHAQIYLTYNKGGKEIKHNWGCAVSETTYFMDSI